MKRTGKPSRGRKDDGADFLSPTRQGATKAHWGAAAGVLVLLLVGVAAMNWEPSGGSDAGAGATQAATTGPEHAATQVPGSGAVGSGVDGVTAEASGPAGAGGWTAVAGEEVAFSMAPLPQLPGTLALRDMMATPGVVRGVYHRDGGGRDDALVIGDPESPGPLLRLSLYRPGAEAQPGGSFFVELARRAGEHGMSVARFVPLPPAPTRLGMTDVALARLDSHGGPRNCVTFRQALANPDLRVSGWVCLADGQTPAPEAAACIIDAVRWQRDEEEPGVAKLFADPARADSVCSTSAYGDLTSKISR